MKRQLQFVLSMAAVLCLVALLRAQDKKEVTLKGSLTCAKCEFKEGTSCQTCLVVKDGDKAVKYYLKDSDATKGVHEKICKSAKDGVAVSGTVEEKDGKTWITPSKVEGL